MAKKVETKKLSKIISYEKLDDSVKSLLNEKYPEGYQNYVVKYPKPDGTFFYAVSLDTETTNYLVKVDVKIDVDFDKDEDKDLIGLDEFKGEGVEDEDEEEEADIELTDIPDEGCEEEDD